MAKPFSKLRASLLVRQLNVEEVLEDIGMPVIERTGHDLMVHCPFTEKHEDDTASCSVHVDKGIFFCYGCGEKGQFFDLLAQKLGTDWQTVAEELETLLNTTEEQLAGTPPPSDETEQDTRPPIDPTLVLAWHENLLNSRPQEKFYLENEWGIHEQTMRQFSLGHDGTRYTIPILDENGDVRNVRRYLPGGKTDKMKSYGDANGTYGSPARLFPLEALGEDVLVLCEGEKDCIVLRHHGFNAITTTGGVNYWNPAWNEFFREKQVYICFDQDQPGQQSMEKVARELSGVADVYLVFLPEAAGEIKGFDVTDFLTKYGGSPEDFRELLLQAPGYSRPFETPEHEDEPVRVPLALASMAKYTGKPIITNVVVSGKDMAPFMVPRKLQVTCSCNDATNSCPTCPRWNGPNPDPSKPFEREVDIPPSDSVVLKLINCSDQQQVGYLRQFLGLAKGCNFGRYRVLDYGNVQQIIIIPELDQLVYDQEEAEYVSRSAYYLGHHIIANRSYELGGYTHPDPRTQIATHVFHHKKDAQDNVSSFVLTEEIAAQLAETFRPKPGQSIEDKLEDIYRHFMHEVHFIRGRPELQLAFDLVWHSVLTFDFLGQPVRKGWLEGLVLGDTSQGKTELTSRMRDYYNLGARITGEKTSSAGLVGGLQKMGERWILQWGAYPQQDRRAILIDEYSSLSEEDIANMTDLRSTGIAEIVKVRTERTHARVRALLCSNARSGHMLRSYMHCITAIQELMGKSEDIRRLDFALIVASGEVSLDLINAPVKSLPKAAMAYSPDACKHLVLYAWSRNMHPKTGQVQFTPEAEQEILRSAKMLGQKYHTKIPLVEPSDQRLKLARMATALATRLFSTSEDFETVLVQKEHVEYVVTWLQTQYDRPSMGYNTWSEAEKRADEFPAGVGEQIAQHLLKLPSGDDIVLFLSSQTRPFRVNDFEAAANIEKFVAKDVISFLTRHHALANTSGGFRSNPNLNDLLRRLRNGEHIGGVFLGMQEQE